MMIRASPHLRVLAIHIRRSLHAQLRGSPTQGTAVPSTHTASFPPYPPTPSQMDFGPTAVLSPPRDGANAPLDGGGRKRRATEMWSQGAASGAPGVVPGMFGYHAPAAQAKRARCVGAGRAWGRRFAHANALPLEPYANTPLPPTTPPTRPPQPSARQHVPRLCCLLLPWQ